MRSIVLFFSLIIRSHVLATGALPNILWITCEDIGQAWGCYGDAQATTPNIDAIAKKGFIFTQAFSNAPICAPARSTLITGRYAPSLGTQHLRSVIPVPPDLKILPELLKTKNYYTSNNAKTDYNFSAQGRWDASGSDAHWRNRTSNQPFFSVFNFGITHEGHTNSYRDEDVASLTTKHDPASIVLPPYWPQTDRFRRIVAHQYDLISVFDQEVQKLIDQLDEDGLRENTIIFIFSDHGFGLPRCKRWLYDSGLRIPFVLSIPEQYQQQCPRLNSPQIDDLIAFVDFAPTVLEMVGLPVSETCQGQSFISGDPKSHVFGFRDRADDVYDMSRSIYDGRYMYIRNFMPQRPYIQDAVIFNKGKLSYDELWKLKKQDKLSVAVKPMFQVKASEEFYDLQSDPHQLNNLFTTSYHQQKISFLQKKLKELMVSIYDTGLLNEGEMLSRSHGMDVWRWMRSNHGPAMHELFEAADRVGKASRKDILKSLDNDAPEIRHWGLLAADAAGKTIEELRPRLRKLLSDSSFVNRVLAAEIFINRLADTTALPVLEEALKTQNEALLLQAAIASRHIGRAAEPLVDIIVEQVYPTIAGEIWGRYKNWMYPMFIGMALDQVLINCGNPAGE